MLVDYWNSLGAEVQEEVLEDMSAGYYNNIDFED
jgi:hypothetical protein